MNILTTRKFATTSARNHGHVLRGGIVGRPLRCEALDCPAGTGSVRCVGFMVTSAVRLACGPCGCAHRTPITLGLAPGYPIGTSCHPRWQPPLPGESTMVPPGSRLKVR